MLRNRNYKRIRSREQGLGIAALLQLSLVLLLVCSSTAFGEAVPATADSAPADASASVSGDGLYDIDATGTDVKFVLEALARRSGANIVVSPDLTGDISVHVKQQSVESILDHLSAVQGFAWRKSGDTYLVASKEKLAKQGQESALPVEPLTLVWKCRHTKPADLVTMVSKLFPEIKVAEGPAHAQPKLPTSSASVTSGGGSGNSSGSLTGSTESISGSLVLIGEPDELKKVEDLLNTLDAFPVQVSIEVAITEINSGSGQNLGIDWSWSDLNLRESTPSGIGFGHFSRTGMSFTGTINALIENNGAKLLAQPNILVIDGSDAQILIGDRILFPKLVGYNQIGAPIYDKDEERVGIYLQLAVKVIDGQVLMTLYPQVSLVTKYLTTRDGSYPQISTREARTTVAVKDGSTLAIGGLLKDNEIKEGTAVPLLSKLPIIGGLFRRAKTTKEHSELVIFLTPKIIKHS